MILHHLQNSRSQRILWLLEELELSYELKLYDTAQAKQTNLNESYRVCRRVNILRDYPDDKIKIYP